MPAVRFRAPRLKQMNSGDFCIELTEAGTWESFPEFAEAFAKDIGARITERVDAPDMRLWKISYLGQPLRLVYDDFPNGISVEPTNKTQGRLIQSLFDKLNAEAGADGI